MTPPPSILSRFWHKIFLLLPLCFALTVTTWAKDRDTTEEKKVSLPVLSITPGMLNFLGDFGYSHFNEPVLGKSAMQIELQKHTDSRLAISLFILAGRVYGEEKTVERQLNFQSGIVAEGLQLRYDFTSRKRSEQVLTPYLSVGLEYMVFHAKGDLKDRNGNPYHYWSDGTIRSLNQSDTGAAGATIMHRDYSYETDLRDANLDGFGKYRQSTLAVPVGAGVMFRVSGRVNLHFGANVHLTFSDLIDNMNSGGEGVRRGNTRKDKIIFSFVSFRYDIAAPRDVPPKQKRKQDKEDYKNVDFLALGLEDADRDGIPDVDDAVIDSTKNIRVDANGRPVDTDDDGIPDYRDKEIQSAKDALVNEEGVTITEEMIEAKWRRDSLAALPAIVEYLHHAGKANVVAPSTESSVKVSDAEKKATPLKVPKIFQDLDIDGNDVIAPGEISTAIDIYLAGNSPYSVTEFYQLIDFFFSQK